MQVKKGVLTKLVFGIALVIILIQAFQVPIFAFSNGVLLVEDPSCNSHGDEALKMLGIPHGTALTEFSSNFTYAMTHLSNWAVIYVSDLSLDNSACRGVLGN